MQLNLRCFFPEKRNGPACLGTENEGIACAPLSFFCKFESTNNSLPTQKEWTIFYVQKKTYKGKYKANTHFFHLNYGNHDNEFSIVFLQRMRFRTKSLLKVLLLSNSKWVQPYFAQSIVF